MRGNFGGRGKKEADPIGRHVSALAFALLGADPGNPTRSRSLIGLLPPQISQ